MAAIPESASDLVVLLSGLKDHGIPLASVSLMVDISTGPDREYVAATAEFVRDERTGSKWLVVRPKPVGA